MSGEMGRGGEAQYEHATSRWHCAHADVVEVRGEGYSYNSWTPRSGDSDVSSDGNNSDNSEGKSSSNSDSKQLR